MEKTTRENFLQLLLQLLKFSLLSNVKNKTICFDIDGTLYDPDDHRLIDPVVEFYNKCIDRGMRVIIVTARPDVYDNRFQTIKILDKLGLKPAAAYYFMGINYKNDVFRYKTDMRYHETKLGNNIVLSIGDNLCDFGKFGGLGILMREQHTINNVRDDENILFRMY
tara:strand:+ start:683 stop:1180 length:498 start_codon:yes stop_codon:yes gene_type:complete